MDRAATAVVCCLVLAACGGETGDPGGSGPASRSPSDDSTLVTEATVLEGQGHGPQLCLGGVMESYPPQCSGPDLVGWDWREVGGFERASGTRWGVYVVAGTYDRDRDTFTLTEPAVPAGEYDGPRPGSESSDLRGRRAKSPTAAGA